MLPWKQNRKHFMLSGGHMNHSVASMANSCLELRILAHFALKGDTLTPKGRARGLIPIHYGKWPFSPIQPHVLKMQFFLLVVLGIKPRPQYLLGKHSTTKSNPQTPVWVSKLNTKSITLFKFNFNLISPYSSLDSLLFPQPTLTSWDSEWSYGSIRGQWWRDHLCEWSKSCRAETTLISHDQYCIGMLPEPSVYTLSPGHDIGWKPSSSPVKDSCHGPHQSGPSYYQHLPSGFILYIWF